jgi:hypothetical protein
MELGCLVRNGRPEVMSALAAFAAWVFEFIQDLEATGRVGFKYGYCFFVSACDTEGPGLLP